MPREFRKKSVNLLITMALLLFTIAIATIAFEFFGSGNAIYLSVPKVVNDAALVGGITYLLYVIGFVPAVLWHLFDFLQRGRAENRVLRSLSGSAFLHVAIIISGCLVALHTTGLFTFTATCGSTFSILSQSCEYTALSIKVPLLISMSTILLLVAIKSIVSIISRSKKTI